MHLIAGAAASWAGKGQVSVCLRGVVGGRGRAWGEMLPAAPLSSSSLCPYKKEQAADAKLHGGATTAQRGGQKGKGGAAASSRRGCGSTVGSRERRYSPWGGVWPRGPAPCSSQLRAQSQSVVFLLVDS